MLYKNGVIGGLLVVALIAAAILILSTVSLEKEQIAADATAVVVNVTADAKKVEMQATLVAEQAKAAQIREEYEGKATLIDAQTDSFVRIEEVKMLRYALEKSEERQDGLIYYIQTGETLVDKKMENDIKTTRWIVVVVVIVIAVLFGIAAMSGSR